MGYAKVRGMTLDHWKSELQLAVNEWSPACSWTVDYLDGKWRCTNDDGESLTPMADASFALVHWYYELAERHQIPTRFQIIRVHEHSS